MSKKVRSSRGEMVDFDLLKIKEEISSSPIPQDVKFRQDYIEKRLRRRLKKVPAPAPKLSPKDNTPSVKLPDVETLTEEPALIDVANEDSDNKTTRQRTRKPAIKKNEDNNDNNNDNI